jgi:hypothetical protein
MAAQFAGQHIADLPPEPDEFDSWADYKTPSIYTNDYEGSCVECEDANWRCAINHVTGKSINFSNDTVHQNYRIQSGGRDTGLDLGSCLDWHSKNAVVDTAGGKHIGGPHASLDIADAAAMSKACYYWRGMKIAIACSQIEGTSPGDIVTGLRPSRAINHCTAALSRKLIKGQRYWECETWGYYIYLDEPSFLAILGEAWVRSIDPDRFLPNGRTVEGWDADELTRQYNIFQGKPI